MASSVSPEVGEFQETVDGMYSEDPWPLKRKTDEEMGRQLRCLGIHPDDSPRPAHPGQRLRNGRVRALVCHQRGRARHGDRSCGAGPRHSSAASKKGGRAERRLVKMDLLNCSFRMIISTTATPLAFSITPATPFAASSTWCALPDRVA